MPNEKAPIVWQTDPAYIAEKAQEYYKEKLLALQASKLALPIWKEMCLLNDIDIMSSYRLAETNEQVRQIGAAIHNLQEVVLMKMLCSGKVSPTGIAVFLKAQHGWREGTELDQFGASDKLQKVNDFLIDIGKMLQNPSPTRVNSYSDNSAENKALLTSGTNAGEK